MSATVQASADPALGAPPTVGSGGASQSMKTVGVLGGGQLGMMMAEAGVSRWHDLDGGAGVGGWRHQYVRTLSWHHIGLTLSAWQMYLV